ncbi:MAG: DUF5320 domain-containing protein [bacterium]
MPRFNGMGPCGLGQRTGRGMGYCDIECNFRRRLWGRLTKEEQIKYLEDEEKALGQDLEDIRKEKEYLRSQNK